MTRTLSHRQATACETARTPRCRCRCRGQFHGACRIPDVTALPETDPHHPGADVDDPQAVLPGLEGWCR